MLPERGNNSKLSRLEAYEIHLCSQKGDHIGYGLCQPRLGASRKVLRRCVRAKGSLDGGEGDLKRRSGKAVQSQCKRGDGD